MPSTNSRIAIIGAGMVGSTIAYASMLKDLAAEIILIDIDKNRQNGEVLDLSHGVFGTATGGVYNGEYSDCKNVDVIVITAGANQKEGQTRLDLAAINTKILKDIAKQIGSIDPETKILMVANPVDILTLVAKEVFPVDQKQIFGSGTFLDTSRLRHSLSQKLKIDSHNIHAYVLGEHGDSSFIPWSVATAAGGKKIDDLTTEQERNQIAGQVRNSAYEIISKKGSTYYGIGVVVTEILEAILFNNRRVLPISTFPGEEYGITDVCLSVPTIIGGNGIESVWKLDLVEVEMQKLHDSANLLREVSKQLG